MILLAAALIAIPSQAWHRVRPDLREHAGYSLVLAGVPMAEVTALDPRSPIWSRCAFAASLSLGAGVAKEAVDEIDYRDPHAHLWDSQRRTQGADARDLAADAAGSAAGLALGAVIGSGVAVLVAPVAGGAVATVEGRW